MKPVFRVKNCLWGVGGGEGVFVWLCRCECVTAYVSKAHLTCSFILIGKTVLIRIVMSFLNSYRYKIHRTIFRVPIPLHSIPLSLSLSFPPFLPLFSSFPVSSWLTDYLSVYIYMSDWLVYSLSAVYQLQVQVVSSLNAVFKFL